MSSIRLFQISVAVVSLLTAGCGRQEQMSEKPSGDFQRFVLINGAGSDVAFDTKVGVLCKTAALVDNKNGNDALRTCFDLYNLYK